MAHFGGIWKIFIVPAKKNKIWTQKSRKDRFVSESLYLAWYWFSSSLIWLQFVAQIALQLLNPQLRRGLWEAILFHDIWDFQRENFPKWYIPPPDCKLPILNVPTYIFLNCRLFWKIKDLRIKSSFCMDINAINAMYWHLGYFNLFGNWAHF